MLSGNTNTFHTKFYNKGARHHEIERQAQHKTSISTSASTATAPVHKKFVAKSNHCDSSNPFINRFSFNNNNAQFSNSNHNNNNNHYSLSLNRHSENHNHINFGVGCINGTLTSPYAFTSGSGGVERNRGGTKSDIGYPVSSSRPGVMMKNNLPKTNYFVHGKPSLLPSVHSDLSIYETTFKESHPNIPDVHRDILNNNNINNCNNNNNNNGNATTSPTTNNVDNTPMTKTTTSSAIMSLSKTGSKLLYTNKHRLDMTKHYVNNNNCNPLTSTFSHNDMNIISQHGPLIYKNDDELMRCDWNNSVFDNPIMSVSPVFFI